MNKTSSNIQGAISLVLAMFIFSLQDIAVKWIGGDYPVLEIVVFRSLIALPCTFLFLRYEGKRGLPTTQQPRLEYIRGFFLFLSFTTYMMGLAALPLADVAAIRNSGPLMITFLSVVWLGEKVGPRRWLALIVGFIGVLLIVKPGSGDLQSGFHFCPDRHPLLCAFCYGHAQTANNRQQRDNGLLQFACLPGDLFYFGAAGWRCWRNS